MAKNYYTYLVTFPGTPYYYYGYHKNDNKPYYGSPVARRWVWEFYDCEVQILEWFESLEEALAVEIRIIRHFLNDPNCLNEHCGGFISTESRRRGGKTAGELTAILKIGCHRPDIPRGGVHHPMYGRTHREESKQKMSESHKGERNSFYGKTHTSASRQKQSLKARERMSTPEAKEKHSKKMKGRSWWTSPEGKTKLSFESPGEGWINKRGLG
jgi:hypothetical protein